MISYQLYSSRNFGPAEDAVRRVAALGYGAVEGYGALLADPPTRAALAAALDETGVRMPTAHVGLATLERDEGIADALASLGVELAFAPFVPAEERPADAPGWRAFAERLARAGERLRAAGLRFGWHNHDFEFAPLPDGSVAMDHLLEAGLDWQFDVAWAVRAGADPMDWTRRHGDRVTAVHVKDIAPAGTKLDEDGWADPGTGMMDWGALASALAASDTVRHWVMEHDNPSDDARFARAGLDLARALPALSGGDAA